MGWHKFSLSVGINLARLGSARLGSARLGSARLGSDRIGSDRIGSDRIGSDRLSSARAFTFFRLRFTMGEIIRSLPSQLNFGSLPICPPPHPSPPFTRLWKGLHRVYRLLRRFEVDNELITRRMLAPPVH